MAISYNDWKKQYESLDAKWKAQYEALAKNSELGQKYMQQYKAWASTTIGGTPVWNSSTTSWTPTIWGTKVWTTQWTNWGSNNTYTIGWKTVGNTSTSNNWGNFTIWGKQVGNNQTEWSTPIADSKPIRWTSTEDAFGWSSSWIKSIFDKPTNNVSNFSVLGINPYGQQTTQKWNNTTNRTSVSTARNTNNTNRATVTPQQQQWDYQDNSQARMNQIADNLDRYTQTNPELFKDYDSFYNFFIAGKGRSEDQKKFLDQYYADYKKNEKYNNMSADEIWVGIANWTIPIDYLDYIKNKDPQKYNEIMLAKSEREDTIRNTWGLQTIVETMWGWDTDNLAWQKKEKVRMDEDDNWIDDRREHYATEEEKGYQKQIADLNARNLEIDNAIKNTYDDLRDRYPWASKSTLMAMANDRNSDLLREKEDNLVELTRLEWYVGYMQAERKEMNDAWDNSIRQLQDNLKLYYTYSPTWMQELADAQYAAAHPTLEAAENWTDTDKARAIESILQWYYDKYWDIIERPMEQVIQDVIAEAKASWKSLYDTLKDNFITPLKSKPQYATISAWGSANGSWTLEAIKDSEWNIVWYVKIDKNTWNIEWVSWYIGWLSWDGNGWYQEWDNWQFTNYTPVSQRDMVQWLKDFMNSFVDENWYLTGKWGQCWHFVNDYLEKIWIGRLYTDPIDKKKAITNTNTPAIWAVAVMDSKSSPQYWHVAIVGNVNKDWTLTLLESNWGNDEKIHIRENVDPSKAKIYGYFNPSIAPSEVANQYWYWENPMSSYLTKLWKKDLNADQKKDLKFVNQTYNLLYRIASSWDLDHLMKSWDLEKLIQNMNSKSFQSTEWEKTFSAVKSMLTKNISDQTNLKTIWDIAELITLKLRKESWAAISAWEWTSWFESFLPWAWENYDTALAKYIRFEQDYLMPSLVYAWWKTEDYKSLFSPNSPYYKKVSNTSSTKSTKSNTANSKWTWSFWTSTNNTQTSNNYDSLYSILEI